MRPRRRTEPGRDWISSVVVLQGLMVLPRSPGLLSTPTIYGFPACSWARSCDLPTPTPACSPSTHPGPKHCRASRPWPRAPTHRSPTASCRSPQDEYALAVDKVRFVGDGVAAVAAVDEATALRALETDRRPLSGPPRHPRPPRGVDPRLTSRSTRRRARRTSSAGSRSVSGMWKPGSPPPTTSGRIRSSRTPRRTCRSSRMPRWPSTPTPG